MAAGRHRKIDISSFMGVINHTTETADGIEFAGVHMPDGKPVTAKGVSRAMLMKDRSMAEGWYEAIKGAYERQTNEANTKSSKGDTPELVIRTADPSASDPRGGAGPAPEDTQSLEGQLQASCTHWTAQVERLDARIADLEAERRDAIRAVRRSEAALQAVLNVDGDE